jgi:hypothetical protein
MSHSVPGNCESPSFCGWGRLWARSQRELESNTHLQPRHGWEVLVGPTFGWTHSPCGQGSWQFDHPIFKENPWKLDQQDFFFLRFFKIKKFVLEMTPKLILCSHKRARPPSQLARDWSSVTFWDDGLNRWWLLRNSCLVKKKVGIQVGLQILQEKSHGDSFWDFGIDGDKCSHLEHNQLTIFFFKRYGTQFGMNFTKQKWLKGPTVTHTQVCLRHKLLPHFLIGERLYTLVCSCLFIIILIIVLCGMFTVCMMGHSQYSECSRVGFGPKK